MFGTVIIDAYRKEEALSKQKCLQLRRPLMFRI